MLAETWLRVKPAAPGCRILFLPSKIMKTENQEYSVIWSWELPEKLSGICVIIDVLAATTNIVRFLDDGVANLFAVSERSVEQGKSAYPDSLVIGESSVLPASFFAASNHPADIRRINVKGKTVLYMTSNGTRAVSRALGAGAGMVVTASYQNLAAVKGWLARTGVSRITVVAAGERSFSDPEVPEDRACANLLSSPRNDWPSDWHKYFDNLTREIRNRYTGGLREEDLPFVTTANRSGIVPVCRPEGDGMIRISDIIR
ncbi:hypothetical protein A2Z33_05725 [Candidatus Gottesmanbacteria bacterium RBG_16_52_11]|uniref:Probable 2-phosphosulfolactate phosphatase n=1 Tax=Candidatus Gottesmanbacteria bacterium RBG_16_52_11 TaxID=1798374 RepID=A0A1F5YXG9_9BACT|nr:MAG: hypothetical protein A2Z33_05725 [Candidatus Gottesmanbacteria bacterium RBG_16_52_11]